MKKFVLILLCALILMPSIKVYAFDEKVPHVRVAILKDGKEFFISIRGSYEIINAVTKETLRFGRHLSKVKVERRGVGIAIEDQVFDCQHLSILTGKDVSLYVKDIEKRYRDRVDIILQKDNKFLVINHLDLEDYTKGVLYHEVSHRWPIEAIKAQAVATRTYALYQTIQNKNLLFDVSSDIYSQVYGGRSAERYRTNIAANRTRGMILKYRGNVLPAYFHACCAGHTEDVRELWKDDLPPLYGRACEFCKTSPLYRWKKNFSSKDVQAKLNQKGIKVDLIQDIKVLEKDESGRVKTLQIESRDGLVKRIPGKKFREIIGPNELKSNFYDIEMKGYFFDISGGGWGHGVGMCQWGALGMAQEHYRYKEILEFYYPESEIINLYERSL